MKQDLLINSFEEINSVIRNKIKYNRKILVKDNFLTVRVIVRTMKEASRKDG